MKRPIEGIGELDQRVTLHHKGYAPDGAGGQVLSTAAAYADTWAHVRPIRGGERLNGERIEAAGGYLVVIRSRADVLEGDVVKWNGRELNVRFPRLRGGRAMYLELECELGVGL
jgi:SPP1 family predicted phage head-tail adaptor